MYVAREFIGSEHRVYLIESGDKRVGQRERSLADGDVIGHPYFPLSEARGFAVGGSSHLWEEWMRARPLDEMDLAERPWLGDISWPFGVEELSSYYERASEELQLPPSSSSEAHALLTGELLRPIAFQYSNRVDFDKIRREIEASDNVCLVPNTSVLQLEQESGTITNAIASSDNPQRFRVAARVFVLAGGGIETPRLMLSSGPREHHGVGNSSGLVGRNFMEHPTVRTGRVALSRPGVDMGFFGFRAFDAGAERGAIAPSSRAVERFGILNCMVMLTETDRVASSEFRRSLAIVRDAARGRSSSDENPSAHLLNAFSRPLEAARYVAAGRGYRPPKRWQLSLTIEQPPRLRSRVSLSDRVDRFGCPRAALDWYVGDEERRTVRVVQDMLDELLRDSGLGRVEEKLGSERPQRVFRGEWHHMGTTRMSVSPRSGVVDPDCRAHDLHNLYIAGSSVFPTSGYANPTLTIVALSLRLAEHLKGPLGRGVSLGPIW